MKTKIVKLYSIDELSPTAKLKALDAYNRNNEFSWANDALKSLTQFAEHFGCKLIDYNIDWDSESQSWAKFDTDSVVFTKAELKEKILSMGSFDRKTMKGSGDCVFTGVTFDEDAADGTRIAFFNKQTDIDELLQAGFRSWINSCVSAYEDQKSLASFTEACEANEYTFLEDGTMDNDPGEPLTEEQWDTVYKFLLTNEKEPVK